MRRVANALGYTTAVPGIHIALISFMMLVHGRATLDMTVTTNGIYVGQTVTFTCKETGKDHVKIRGWLKNGLNMSLSQESRITTAPPYYKDRLTLQQAVTSDSGVYTCVAEDGRNASQNLIVYCAIVPFKMPVTRAIVGSNTTLRCDAECYEYVFWAKNGTFVDTSEPERFYQPGNGSILYITNVGMSDNGSFLCEFINARTAYISVELLVIVPSSTVTLKTEGRAKVGHDFEIRCQTDGTPLPESVSWYNNSRVLVPTSRVRTHYDKGTGMATLLLKNISRYSLSIECRFKQELLKERFHYLNASLRIIPTGKPDPPTQLVIDVMLSNPVIRSTARLSWIPPVYTGHLNMLAYRVAYWDDNKCSQPLHCNEEEYWLSATVLSHQFELKGYTNHTRICFTVQSVNNDGLSGRSHTECIGVSQPPPLPTSVPATSHAQASAIEATTLSPTFLKQAFPTNFQLVLENMADLCSGRLKVTKYSLTRALAEHFTKVSLHTVVPTDLTAHSVVQFGGVIHYAGTVKSFDSDRLITTLSSNVRAGHERLRLLGSYLSFLASCPALASGELCTMTDEDSYAFGCPKHRSTTDVPTRTVNPSPDSSSDCFVVYTALSASFVGVLVLIVLVVLCCSYRSRDIEKAQILSMCRSSSQKSILVQANGYVQRSEDRESVSQASTSNSSEVNDVNLRAASSRSVLTQYPRVERYRTSTIYNNNGLGSEDELYSHSIRISGGKGREETRV